MVKQALLLLIRVYQLTLSPLLGPCCRFEPSCSRYAAACIQHHGVLRGAWLALRRLLRCHPFHPGGYDPPPLSPGHEARVAAAPLANDDTSEWTGRQVSCKSPLAPSVQRPSGSELSVG
jgi:putative membrane protein insertion efficiency factor